MSFESGWFNTGAIGEGKQAWQAFDGKTAQESAGVYSPITNTAYVHPQAIYDPADTSINRADDSWTLAATSALLLHEALHSIVADLHGKIGKVLEKSNKLYTGGRAGDLFEINCFGGKGRYFGGL